MEQKKRVALFDFDGVIADTEPLYDLFWNDAAQRYGLPYENFAQRIKGTTMPLILATYFQQHTPAQIDQLFAEIAAFERDMSFPEIPGSDDSKMAHAFRALPIRDLFDTLVTADRITNGKPDPMCYLLAAEDLQVNPADCIVFEDSFAGIEAATRAGMTIVGISSTNPAEALRPLVDRVIPNFNGLRPEELFV